MVGSVALNRGAAVVALVVGVGGVERSQAMGGQQALGYHIHHRPLLGGGQAGFAQGGGGQGHGKDLVGAEGIVGADGAIQQIVAVAQIVIPEALKALVSVGG